MAVVQYQFWFLSKTNRLVENQTGFIGFENLGKAGSSGSRYAHPPRMTW
jgi:hypothetical protein